MTSNDISAPRFATNLEKYEFFLKRVVSSEKLWAIWCGATWATASDPDKEGKSMFLLWPTKASAEISFRLNEDKFPAEAEVDSIDLQKWLNLYTRDLLQAGASAFIFPDEMLNGLEVDPSDLKRDISGMMFGSELQGADLTRLRNSVASAKDRKT